MANKSHPSQATTGSRARPHNLTATLTRFVGYMGHARKRMFAVAVLVIVAGIANLVGTYMIKPVVNAIAAGNWQLFVHLVVACALVYALGVASVVGYTQTMVSAAATVVFDIRRDLLEHVIGLPLSYFDRTRHGDIMSFFTNDVDTVSEALNNAFANMCQAAVQTIGTLALLFVLNWRLTLITVACDIIITIYINFSGSRSKALFAAQQATLGKLDGYAQEMLSGQKVVKVFNHEAQNLATFSELNGELARVGTGAQAYAATMVPITVAISYANYAIVAVVGGLMATRGLIDVGSLASYLVFVRQAAMPINQLTQLGNFMLGALAGAERIFQVLDTPAEKSAGTVTLIHTGTSKDPDNVHPAAKGASGWAWQLADETLRPLAGDVRFDHVSFGYVPDTPVLKDLTLFAKPGQKVAFVGSTGAGKTTITNLINRFYDIDAGSITYDGINLSDIDLASLRSSLGIVLQDTHLFAGTIADNIRFGNLDATDDEVRAAAHLANADAFITRLPQGYNTRITSDGANLSQGQRQLIAIARAAISNPPVLILDEATSSIDTRTEALIARGMNQLMAGRTTFVIAHRLSTVRDADVIIVLEHGHIVERGTHEELLAHHGEYYDLWTGAKELD